MTYQFYTKNFRIKRYEGNGLVCWVLNKVDSNNKPTAFGLMALSNQAYLESQDLNGAIVTNVRLSTPSGGFELHETANLLDYDKVR
jgi:hypothetical protein